MHIYMRFPPFACLAWLELCGYYTAHHACARLPICESIAWILFNDSPLALSRTYIEPVVPPLWRRAGKQLCALANCFAPGLYDARQITVIRNKTTMHIIASFHFLRRQARTTRFHMQCVRATPLTHIHIYPLPRIMREISCAGYRSRDFSAGRARLQCT